MSDKLAQVFHFDLFGKRENKYDFLNENSLASIEWKLLQPAEPNYFFVNRNFEAQELYNKGFSINELFINQSMGITSGNDSEYIDLKKFNLINKYGELNIKKIDYRVFDLRYINYDSTALARARRDFMRNLLYDNYAISFLRRSRNDVFVLPYITKHIVDKCIISTLDNANIFPLYLYPESNEQLAIGQAPQRTPNLNMEIVNEIAKGLGLVFIPEPETGNVCFANNNHEMRDDFKQVFTPMDLLDYIYAVLHSPAFREKYKEFLKIDFPRIPYPTDADRFWTLVNLGGQLRKIHLLESPAVGKYITQYPIDGDNLVTRKITKNSPGFVPADSGFGKVYINDTQYFDNVPEIAWNFYIGGYQPAQKWLKDRTGRKLEFEDIIHYQKIIVALAETDRLMREINKINVE